MLNFAFFLLENSFFLITGGAEYDNIDLFNVAVLGVDNLPPPPPKPAGDEMSNDCERNTGCARLIMCVYGHSARVHDPSYLHDGCK